jgi:hypothetical protein
VASLRQLLVSIQQQVEGVTGSLSMFNSPISVLVALDWPPVRTIQDAVKMNPPTALVSVFDRKSRDSTRWIPSVVAETITNATLVSSPPSQVLAPFGVCQVTLSAAPGLADAVSMVLYSNLVRATADPGDGSYTDSPTAAAVVSAGRLDTPTTLASALAAASRANPALAALATFAAVGPAVTVTSLSRAAILVSSYTGNGGTLTTELARRCRDVQLSIWCPTTEIRDTVGSAVEVLVAQMEMFYGVFYSGLPLADGSIGRVLALNDHDVDDPVLSDMYRRDIILSVDYPITVMDNLYAVLAPVLQYQFTA